MLPNRYTLTQSSNIRKSRLEGKHSFLPKPKRPASIDRVSVEGRRPSGIRSSSAEPRSTMGPHRHSRDTSASKIPMNRRSRSQQGETDRRYGQVSMTPLRSSNLRSTTMTPVRTPTDDRSSRSWQASIDRAIASVTIKDNRPLSNTAWQRSEMARVQEALNSRASDGTNTSLIRPLTIVRFVDITSSLLQAIIKDSKLNKDNYVTRLPHTAKRLLYPAPVSKSWLKTVNTLHAFPHALALIAYLIDLVARIETPVDDEKLYAEKDELAYLRRQYLYKCWIRFQDPGHQFEDINDEYLEQLKQLLGNDEERVIQLQQIVNEMNLSLQDEAEMAARADEARRVKCRSDLLVDLRAERAARIAIRGAVEENRNEYKELVEQLKSLEIEIEKANVESQQLKVEVENQPMSVVERTKLLEEVDYANRVIDSKRVLARQISEMVQRKETDLALWQKKTLDSCVEYNKRLIHLSTAYPQLAQLAVDEKELMGEKCLSHVVSAHEALKQKYAELQQTVSARERERMTDKRRRANTLGEIRTKLDEIRAKLDKEQSSFEAEKARELNEAQTFAIEQREITAKIKELKAKTEEYEKVNNELAFWEKQNDAWTSKLTEFRSYISKQREYGRRKLDEAKDSRVKLVMEAVTSWNAKLDLLAKLE